MRLLGEAHKVTGKTLMLETSVGCSSSHAVYKQSACWLVTFTSLLSARTAVTFPVSEHHTGVWLVPNYTNWWHTYITCEYFACYSATWTCPQPWNLSIIMLLWHSFLIIIIIIIIIIIHNILLTWYSEWTGSWTRDRPTPWTITPPMPHKYPLPSVCLRSLMSGA